MQTLHQTKSKAVEAACHYFCLHAFWEFVFVSDFPEGPPLPRLICREPRHSSYLPEPSAPLSRGTRQPNGAQHFTVKSCGCLHMISTYFNEVVCCSKSSSFRDMEVRNQLLFETSGPLRDSAEFKQVELPLEQTTWPCGQCQDGSGSKMAYSQTPTVENEPKDSAEPARCPRWLPPFHGLNRCAQEQPGEMDQKLWFCQCRYRGGVSNDFSPSFFQRGLSFYC